jgi:hypothetical protein
VEDSNAQSIGVQDIALNVPRIPDQELQASSMILAYSITDLPPRMLGTDMFALGEKRIKPNPGGVFRTNENLNVWQEIYGLTVDSASRKPSATFELVISEDKREIRKLTSTATELLGAGQTMTYTNSVPLGKVGPGSYDIQLKVTDNLAKVSFVTVGKFSVVSPSAQSDPTRNISAQQNFDRACTSCHSAQIAMGLTSLGTPFSIPDRELLSLKQAELAQLLMKGLKGNHPDVIKVQSEISVLLKKEADTKNAYSTYVFSHMKKVGGNISGPELPMLIEYVFEEAGRKVEPSIPSDIPLQRQ